MIRRIILLWLLSVIVAWLDFSCQGTCVSGSIKGAGGIGGLLARTDTNGSTYYHADGNGNITALMDGNENIVARYLYNPYGKLLGQWGPMANANTMQFSSMPQRRGIALFPFRGYEPNFQRWLNQDPVREAGGINFYGYVNNRPLGYVDPFGLSVYSDLGDAELAAYSSAANFFTGSQNASTADPNSYLALTGQAGLITPLSDADGNSASTALGNAAADSLGMAAAIGGMMLPGGAEDEAAAALAAKLGKELSDCEKAAKAAADAAKALPNVAKAVNSNLAHAAEQAAERKVFNSTSDAADALRSLSESITKNGFPAGTLQDTAYADRVLVPVGNNGMAVYQVGANGTAKLKTVLIAH